MKTTELHIPSPEDREEPRGRRPPSRIPGCPELDALVVEPSQHTYVRDGFGTADRVARVKIDVPGFRRPFLLSVTRRRRFSEVTWSLVVEAPIRGIPRLYADTCFAASDAFATAVSIELVHRFGETFAAMASTRGLVRLAIHAEAYTPELAMKATQHLVDIVALLRRRLEVPRARPRLARAQHDALRALVERTEILDRERDSAFFHFRDAFAAWRAPLHTADAVWWTGPVDHEVRGHVRNGAVEVAREGSVWPELVVRSRGAPSDVSVTPMTDPRGSTFVRVVRARLRRACEWFGTGPDAPRGCTAEFEFERGSARLRVIPPDPRALDVAWQRESVLRWQFHVLESDVMRFHDATRNVPRTHRTPLGYERLLGALGDYAGETGRVEEPPPRGLTSTLLPKGWK